MEINLNNTGYIKEQNVANKDALTKGLNPFVTKIIMYLYTTSEETKNLLVYKGLIDQDHPLTNIHIEDNDTIELLYTKFLLLHKYNIEVPFNILFNDISKNESFKDLWKYENIFTIHKTASLEMLKDICNETLDNYNNYKDIITLWFDKNIENTTNPSDKTSLIAFSNILKDIDNNYINSFIRSELNNNVDSEYFYDNIMIDFISDELNITDNTREILISTLFVEKVKDSLKEVLTTIFENSSVDIKNSTNFVNDFHEYFSNFKNNILENN